MGHIVGLASSGELLRRSGASSPRKPLLSAVPIPNPEAGAQQKVLPLEGEVGSPHLSWFWAVALQAAANTLPEKCKSETLEAEKRSKKAILLPATIFSTNKSIKSDPPARF
ncbi:MAG: hypothetical protein ACLR2E_03980 [Lachnospiraceae bacterium]